MYLTRMARTSILVNRGETVPGSSQFPFFPISSAGTAGGVSCQNMADDYGLGSVGSSVARTEMTNIVCLAYADFTDRGITLMLFSPDSVRSRLSILMGVSISTFGCDRNLLKNGFFIGLMRSDLVPGRPAEGHEGNSKTFASRLPPLNGRLRAQLFFWPPQSHISPNAQILSPEIQMY
jgi:hypothetical protein